MTIKTQLHTLSDKLMGNKVTIEAISATEAASVFLKTKVSMLISAGEGAARYDAYGPTPNRNGHQHVGIIFYYGSEDLE